MAKMLGARLSENWGCCHWGCCMGWGNGSRHDRDRAKRSIKRREKNAWKRELTK